MKRIIFFITIIFLSTIYLHAQNPHIVINKKNLTLTMLNQAGDTLFHAPVCVGKNIGNKQRVGDMRTPEGNFYICQIQDASSWTHDFNDGAGERKGAYGPYFMRLKTPWKGIGIHGTCFPERISTRDSEGCVRLLNSDLIKLRKLVTVGTPVTILPD